MNTLDQAFWQLFHAVDASLADDALLGRLRDADPNGVVEIDLNAPAHTMGILRREAERRGSDYPALIAAMSEERAAELPAWWMAIARNRAVGVEPLPALKKTALEL
jgi:hypothetical protein